jgi:hypothetical protein
MGPELDPELKPVPKGAVGIWKSPDEAAEGGVATGLSALAAAGKPDWLCEPDGLCKFAWLAVSESVVVPVVPEVPVDMFVNVWLIEIS